MILNNDVEIWLPEEDAVAALQQLAKLDEKYNLLSREFGVVDLRLPDKLYLRKRGAGESQGPLGPADIRRTQNTSVKNGGERG